MLQADFPQTLPDFLKAFGTDDQCRDYLFRQKWPDGFVCPKCGHRKAWHLDNRDIWVCAKCEYHCSLIVGTALEGTRKPLRDWFLAMYFMASSKRGLSAKELQRHLRCSYQTAWAWLHKLRAAMVDPNRQPLQGQIESDEAYIGGPEEGLQGRGAEKKTIIICAAERQDDGYMGRIRLGILETAGGDHITEFLKKRVEKGTTIHTDGWRGYNALTRSGFRHLVTAINASKEKAHTILPHVHLVFSLVKRWVLGTHQGSVSRKHLPSYLEEFTFRFNRRKAKKITHFFERLAEGLVREKCQPYWKIVGRLAADRPLRMAA